MILTLVIGAFLVVMVLAWQFQPRQEYPTEKWEPADDGVVDREELERAEREVRGWGVAAKPDDERPEEDWGPGTAK